jgi:hypothetical protein
MILASAWQEPVRTAAVLDKLLMNVSLLHYYYTNLSVMAEPHRERLNDRRLSAKLVPAFADRGCHVVSVTDPY